MLKSSRSSRVAVVLALTAALSLTACTTGGGGKSASSSGSKTSATSAAPTVAPVALELSPTAGDAAANPASPVTAKAEGGKLTAVTLTDANGTSIPGKVSAGNASWKSAAPLSYGASYTFAVTGTNSAGVASTETRQFTTLSPQNMTMPSFRTTFGVALTDGATYGVGLVTVVHFDEKVTDKKAAEAAIKVKTSPAVTGAWYWLDDQNAHWRPENYYATGTKVTFSANVFGKELSPGLYGQADATTSFVIGQKHVSVADDNTHQVQVFFDDALVRTMPTSMGRGGSTNINGKTISFWTQPGTYTVLDKATEVTMDSSTYGLPVDSPLGYKEKIPYATRISNDGIFLHELDSTVWAQGVQNTSHGCLNLNRDNAMWFYQNAQVGDVVEIKNTGGAPLEVWQNGDWSVPWATWVAGGNI